jgi:MFS transporter, BCD family, chlorophyll transporter
MSFASLSWFQIFRLGLVQAALGAIVVLTTSTLNRIMVVELALPAMLPGALVALHYAMQILRPWLGHGSDVGGRRTPWIVGGMAVLALGGLGAAVATAWMGTDPLAGITLAALSFVMIGIGVGACGTTLLVLLAKRVDDRRRAAAATIVWVMMIMGFIVTTAIAGRLLDPYSSGRLVVVAGAVSVVAMAVTMLAIWNVEGRQSPGEANVAAASGSRETSFRAALADVWSEPRSRRFAIFIFVSMLAYSAPELILEPFAGSVYGLTPGETTTLASVQHGGVLIGMTLVALFSSAIGERRFVAMRILTVGGCIGSAVALVNLAAAGLAAPASPVRTAVFMLGVTNGVYAVAAIGSMMSLVGSGQKSREGVRMGLWGAAQAIAFGLGGFVGTLASDLARLLMSSASPAYASVFAGEAVLFLVSAVLAIRVYADEKPPAMQRFTNVTDFSATDASRSRP